MNAFLKSILDGIHVLIPSYGWCVVAFTILVRLCLMPLDYKSRVGMRKMTQLAPKQAALQKKYEKDPEKMQRKLAELYKKERVSPMSSCWPMLVSMPILIAMFTAMRMMANEQLVQQAFDIILHGEPVLEPFLWIKNLWMPDSPFNAAWPSVESLQLIEAGEWMSGLKTLNLGELANLSGVLNVNLGAVALPDLSTLQVVTEGANLSGLVTVKGNELMALAEVLKADLSALNLTGDSLIAMTEAAHTTLTDSIYHAYQPLFTAGDQLKATIKLVGDTMQAVPEYGIQTAPKPHLTIELLITRLTVVNVWNGLFLLPLMSAASQYLMTVLNPSQPQPTGNSEQAQQQASTGNFMKWFFPLFSLFLCSSYNAAFALYWVTSNLIAMAQNTVINKYLDHKEKIAAEAESNAVLADNTRMK